MRTDILKYGILLLFATVIMWFISFVGPTPYPPVYPLTRLVGDILFYIGIIVIVVSLLLKKETEEIEDTDCFGTYEVGNEECMKCEEMEECKKNTN